MSLAANITDCSSLYYKEIGALFFQSKAMSSLAMAVCNERLMSLEPGSAFQNTVSDNVQLKSYKISDEFNDYYSIKNMIHQKVILAKITQCFLKLFLYLLLQGWKWCFR